MGVLTSIEICAGAGGQALGLELAGFHHAVAVEIDSNACATLRLNRHDWNVLEQDLNDFSARPFRGIDLFAGGVPCPPFSIAGKQLGEQDERDLFPTALRMIAEAQPKAVMLENVKGLSGAKFAVYRQKILGQLAALGYIADWQIVNASDFGVPQLRPRFVLVALKEEYAAFFRWPTVNQTTTTVGDTLFDLMAENGWQGASCSP